MTAEPQDTLKSASKPGFAGVTFEGVALRELSYRELLPPGEEKPEDLGDGGIFHLGVAADAMSESSVVLFFEFDIQAESDRHPVELKARFSTVFSKVPEIAPEPFVEFLARQGAPIVFPYIRELVANISQRGVYPVVNLNPVVLAPVLDDAAKTELINALNGFTESRKAP